MQLSKNFGIFCYQELPVTIAEARTGRTPTEAAVWMQMHEDFLKEIQEDAVEV